MRNEDEKSERRGFFPPTRWSLVRNVRADRTTIALDALGSLFSLYRQPLVTFLRHSGHSVTEAEELVQGFFAHAVESQLLVKAAPERGTLRSFLLSSLKHYTVSEFRKRGAQKRGGGRPNVPLEEVTELDQEQLLDPNGIPAERCYDLAWARSIARQAAAALEQSLHQKGKRHLFVRLSPFLLSGAPTTGYESAASALGISTNALKLALQRLRRAYYAELRKAVSVTVATSAETDDEVRYILELLKL